jgi:hypothetical protein
MKFSATHVALLFAMLACVGTSVSADKIRGVKKSDEEDITVRRTLKSMNMSSKSLTPQEAFNEAFAALEEECTAAKIAAETACGELVTADALVTSTAAGISTLGTAIGVLADPTLPAAQATYKDSCNAIESEINTLLAQEQIVDDLESTVTSSKASFDSLVADMTTLQTEAAGVDPALTIAVPVTCVAVDSPADPCVV